MKTGVIVSLPEEIKSILEYIMIEEIHTINDIKFYYGKYKGKSVVVTQSGIGKVNAAMVTQQLISIFKVTHVISISMATSLDDMLEPGSVVLVEDSIQFDVNAVEYGFEYGEIPHLDTYIFNCDPTMMRYAIETVQSENINYKVVTGRLLTGDQFVSDVYTKSNLKRIHNAQCVDMVGAAITQVCFKNNIPVVAIRSIADSADSISYINFSDFITLAIENATVLARGILEKI